MNVKSRMMQNQQLRRREFMDEVWSACELCIGDIHSDVHIRKTMNLIKVHFNSNYRVHYELMISAENGLIEVGLHFEDGPDSTARLLQHFDQYIVEIKHRLGANFDVERWTRSWGHCFEIHPIEPLTVELAQRLGQRLADIIDVLQPILAEATALGLVSIAPRPARGRPRYRSRN